MDAPPEIRGGPMAELVIRYVNGRRVISIDHNPPSKLECVLHNKARERRIPLPPELEGVPIRKLEKAFGRWEALLRKEGKLK
jgi:hypothetical protein